METKKNFLIGFWSVIILLLLFTAYGIYQKYTPEQKIIDIQKKKALTSSVIEKLAPFLNNFTKEQKEKILQDMEKNIDKSVDVLFENAYKNIDSYLDFHYSVLGEYKELTLAITDNLQKNIQKKLFGEDFDTAFTALQNSISKDFTKHISKLADEIKTQLNQNVQLSTQEEKEVFDTLVEIFEIQIQQSVNRVVRSTTLGATAGGGVVAAAVASKLVAKKVAQKAAIKGGSKFAAKLVASGTAATSGLACGPFALICGAVIGTTVWIGTDIALVAADENLNREGTYNDIKISIDETKQLLKDDLKNQYKTILENVNSEVQIGLDRKVKDLMNDSQQ